MLTLVAALAAGVALTGCRTMAPPYVQPAAPVASTFPGGGDPAATATAADVPWQEFLQDAQLRAIVAQALESNRDLRSAVIGIERARALYRIQRAALLPTVNGAVSGTRQRIPEGLFGGIGGGAFNAEQYSASVGVSGYELDVFGRIRSLNEQALQQFLATEQARRAVQIALVAEVAQAWLTYAADTDRLRLAHETLDNQQAALTLTRQRLEAGITSALAVRQAETTVESARVDAARYLSQMAQDRNAIELLVGAPVGDAQLPATPAQALAVLADLPAGTPSDLLQRRPDILAAEHDLRAAYANIGAARARFFPTVSLTGSLATASRSLSSLFTAGTG
ncbi:MAG: efflux transporter outer membrane subunit, partial [Luteitalea sp.]